MGVYLRGRTWWMCFKLPSGEYIRKSANTQNKKLAETIYAKQRVAVAENKYLDVKRESTLTFREFSESYLERHAKPYKRSWESTDAVYIRFFNRSFGNVCLSSITQQLVERFLAEQRGRRIGTRKDGSPWYPSPARLNRLMTCLKTMFNKAVEWGELTQSPCANIKKFKENNTITRFLTDEEMRKLYQFSSLELRQIVTVLIHTGMRKGELQNLSWSDLDFERDFIKLTRTKNGKTRYIPMNQVVKRVLLQRRIEKESPIWVFPGPLEKPYNFRKAFDTARKKAGLDDVRIHDLRHTFASHLCMKGAGLMEVKALLGHSSLEMTERYSHLTDRHKADAVARLEELPDGYVTVMTQSGNS